MVVVLTLIMSVQIGHLYQVNMKNKSIFGCLAIICLLLVLIPPVLTRAEKHSLVTWEKKSKNVVSMYLELQEKEAYVGSDQYIVDTAKSKLGMTYPDEIVFKEK